MSSLFSDGFPGLAGSYGTILIDPPWRFQNRTGKMAPEHKRLRRYPTMSFEEIAALPVAEHARPKSHLYMWCPNALLLEALQIRPEAGMVENFAVINNLQTAVFVAHGLVSARDVDNAEPAMAQSHEIVTIEAAAIGTTMGDPIGHGTYKVPAYNSIR